MLTLGVVIASFADWSMFNGELALVAAALLMAVEIGALAYADGPNVRLEREARWRSFGFGTLIVSGLIGLGCLLAIL